MEPNTKLILDELVHWFDEHDSKREHRFADLESSREDWDVVIDQRLVQPVN